MRDMRDLQESQNTVKENALICRRWNNIMQCKTDKNDNITWNTCIYGKYRYADILPNCVAFRTYGTGLDDHSISLWGIGGLILLSLGIIGEYVGKIYMEVKERPRFIIEKLLYKE